LRDARWPRPVNSETRYGGFTRVGEPYGMVGATLLVNLAQGRPAWRFEVPQVWHDPPPVVTSGGPDFWALVTSERGQSLSSFKLPHAAALALAKEAPEFYIAGPGSTISLKMNFDAPDEVKASLEKAVLHRVEELGMKVADNQQVALHVETEFRNTGEQAIVERLRPIATFGPLRRSGPEEKVNIHVIIVRASYYVDGQLAWSQSQDFLPRGETWADDLAKTTEQEIIDLQWKRIATQAKAYLLSHIPGYIVNPAAQAKFPSGPYPAAQAAPLRPR
jgi:hypothetical protein